MQLSKTDLLLWLAGNLVGTQEVGGANKGALVERFQKAVDGKAQGESWCLAFLQFCIREVDALGLAHGDMSGSPLPRSEWVKLFWESAPIPLKRKPTEAPDPGMLIVWRQYGANGQPTDKGHIGLVTGIDPATSHVLTIEGNTSGGAGLNRDGDGVYRRSRNPQGDGPLRVVGYLKVWG